MYLHKEFRAAELGGDASENGDFQRRKQRLQGPFFQELSFYIQKELMNDFSRYVFFGSRSHTVKVRGDIKYFPSEDGP